MHCCTLGFPTSDHDGNKYTYTKKCKHNYTNYNNNYIYNYKCK